MKTLDQYNEQLAGCRDIYAKKVKDYGTSWRALRPSSLTDQIFIKAQRIRTIEESNEQMIEEGVESEYKGVVNYCIIALIQLELGWNQMEEIPTEKAIEEYDEKAETARALMLKKNHDYGEAWREMRTTSMTDMILQKLLRIKSIEENDGTTIISEGVDAGYLDIINYAIFALIQLSEKK